MRTITRSEFVNGAGEGVYVSTVHYASAAEREAGDAACQRVVVAQAFVPFGHKGEPFDPPEEWPSDRTATEYAPEAVSTEYAVGAVKAKPTHFNGIPLRLPDGHLNPVAISAVIRKVMADQMPPNCDGDARYGQEPTQAGQFIAQALHTAAEGESDCSTVGCVIPQAKDNGSD